MSQKQNQEEHDTFDFESLQRRLNSSLRVKQVRNRLNDIAKPYDYELTKSFKSINSN